MPRSGPRRILAATKLTAGGIAWIKERALDEGLTIRGGEANQSEMMRIMLAYSSIHMPKGWRPPSTSDV